MAEDYADIIAITGHRDYPDRAALYSGLDQMSAKQYYFGGARGIDSDALAHIARTQPGSIRTVVVPNRLIDQPASAQNIIKQHATNVIELRNTGPDRYMIRNKYMVDKSTKTHAFYDYRGRGGTYNTIEYAHSKGKLGKVHSLREFNIKEFRNMSRKEFDGTMKQMKRYKEALRGFKMIALNIIQNIYQMTVYEYFLSLGYKDIKTLEQYWKL